MDDATEPRHFHRLTDGGFLHFRKAIALDLPGYQAAAMKVIVFAAVFVSTVLPALGEDIGRMFFKGSDAADLKFIRHHPELIEKKDDMECTPLHYAAILGRIKTARWLIEHKADVNTVAYSKFTPMHVVKVGPIAALLIQAGADLKAIDGWGKTPLQEAAFLSSWGNSESKGHKDVCEVILASGYPLDLLSALWLGKRDAAIKMIKENPALAQKINSSEDLWGNTSPLGVAALRGDKEIVELLLKAGAPVNNLTFRPNGPEVSPLCNAVGAGHYEVAEILCNAGAECNLPMENDDDSLLDYALKNSEKRMVELLLKHGAKSAKEK